MARLLLRCCSRKKLYKACAGGEEGIKTFGKKMEDGAIVRLYTVVYESVFYLAPCAADIGVAVVAAGVGGVWAF